MSKHNNPLIVAPGGARCLHCNNPQPCFAHSEIILKGKDGKDIRIPNMPTMLGMIINRLTEIEKRLGMGLPAVSITHEKL